MTKFRAHYTLRMAKMVCEMLATGTTLEKSLKKIGDRAPTMKQIWRWIDEIPEFKEMYERARQLQADNMADRMLDMAQEVIEKPRSAAAYRVANDILKWQAEMRNPGKYGSKVTHEIKAPPLDPVKMREEIKRLELELSVSKPNEPKNEVVIVETNEEPRIH